MIGTILGDVDVLPNDTYDGLDQVWLIVSTDGITDRKLEGLFLGVWLGSVDRIELGFKEGTETGILMR